MRGRRNRQAPVSLFAFQDVMAAVIGILFFIVLIMALDLVTRPKATGAGVSVPERSAVAQLQSEVAGKKTELDRLEREVKHLASEMRFLSTADPKAKLAHVNTLERRLNELYEEIREGQGQSRELDEELAKLRRELKGKKKELEKTIQREKKLKELAGGGPRRPRVTYIVGAGDTMTPWLVEIDDERIRVGAADGQSAAFTFGADPFTKRQKHFLAWAKTQNRRTHYFVLLVKPSGVKQADALKKAVKSLEFDIGMDLLPENWVAFE